MTKKVPGSRSQVERPGASTRWNVEHGTVRVSELLLPWYAKVGRDLPWRNSRDPYRIWLSEIMLQQTGVAAVIPYYQRFLVRFPEIASLAAADLDEVIALWAGLGYYSRARNLHAAARRVVTEHGGAFPADLKALQALPGIGRSTAGAILSIAFDRKGPILDGNVRRVLARLLALEEDPRAPAGEKLLWSWATELTPDERPHDYAQAIMDLGATVCMPRRPACERCPLAQLCQARLQGKEEQLPVRRSRKVIPEVRQVALLLERQRRFLVCKRPYEGMLGGLWEFPTAGVTEGQSPAEAASSLLRRFGTEAPPSLAGGVTHAYSHFRLDLHLFHSPAPSTVQIAEGLESRWLSAGELTDFPLHGAHKKALTLIDNR
jgi:A/G-specific adenine glycosylase